MPGHTREEIEQAFRDHKTVEVLHMSYWMNPATGEISGLCCEGTCDGEYANFAEFFEANKHELAAMKIR